MGNDKVIVAIELGSSKVSGVAGHRLNDGSLKVLAYYSVPSSSYIKYGAVYNVDKSANAIVEVISRLEAIMDTRIEKVYIGYNAKGLRSVTNSIKHQFDEETVVTENVINSMFDQCSQVQYDGYLNLSQESQEYSINNKQATETEPIGVTCHELEGNYLNLLIRKQVVDNLFEQCVSQVPVEMVDGYITPIVEAKFVLTNDDKQQGCALVDYGADITTVSIYKNGMLRFLRVIPMGSTLITSDLAKILNIKPEQAENLKMTYGLCNLIGNQDNGETVLINDQRVALKDIGDIIEARNEEIIRNVVAQIKASGYSDVLYAGIVLTGGGSQLRQLDQVFVKLLPSMRKPKLAIEPLCGVVWDETTWKRGDGTQLGVLSVMAHGDENCCVWSKLDVIDRLKPEDHSKLEMPGLFTEDGESAIEERTKLEEEKRKREEEEKQKETKDTSQDVTKDKNFFKDWLKSIKDKSNDFLNKAEKVFDED